MLALYVKLMLDGTDRVPMTEIEDKVVAFLEGRSIDVKDEEGSRAFIVIDEAITGDFTVEVD